MDAFCSRIHLSKFRKGRCSPEIQLTHDTRGVNYIYHLHRPTPEDDVNGSRAQVTANHELDGGMFRVQ